LWTTFHQRSQRTSESPHIASTNQFCAILIEFKIAAESWLRNGLTERHSSGSNGLQSRPVDNPSDPFRARGHIR